MEDRSISVLKRKATELGFRTEKLPSGALVFTDFLPALEGRGFPSRGFIVPTIGSGLYPSFGGQSSGSENHSHLKMGLSPKLRLVPWRKRKITVAPPTVPLSPQSS
jgi:hypothetical protein